MATIRDAAKLAGVAPTVTHYIYHSDYCSPETRQRVENAIAKLIYVPNRMIRGL